MSFKVGNKVKVIKAFDNSVSNFVGMIGTIEEIINYGIVECAFIDFGFERAPDMFFPDELVDIEQ